MRTKLTLIGAGGHCNSCIDVIEQTNQYEIVGILDATKKEGELILGYLITGSDNIIEEHIQKKHQFLISIGQIKSSAIRERIFFNLKKNNAKLATIISPRAYVSKHATIEEGTIVMHDALINANVHIGKNCIINTKALIEHDASVHDHCHISTSAVLNGGTTVQSGTFLGSNATTKEYSETKKNDFLKAHSLYLGKET